MYDISTIRNMMETFTISANVPLMYFDNTYDLPQINSQDVNFKEIMEYADFPEIINFMENDSVDTNEVCTYYTSNFFAYVIVRMKNESKKNAFMVSGPFLSYSREESYTKEFVNTNNFSVHKRLKAENVIMNFQVVSDGRIAQLGQMLKMLTTTEENMWYSVNHKSIGDKSRVRNPVYKYLDYNYSSQSELNKQRIKFFFMLKNKTLRGDSENIAEFIKENSTLTWDDEKIGESLQMFKYRSLVICTMAAAFAFEANAVFDKIINVISSYLVSLLKIKSNHEVFMKTVLTLEETIHLVAVNISNNYSLHVNRVIQFIKAHYTEKITLQGLADYVGLSQVYLSALIKRETGMSFLEIVNSIRVEEGKNLLLFTNKSINEIAHTLGYTYQNHFNKIFKESTGMTPIEFRQNYGNSFF